jgi:hypothetical protein
MSLGKRSLDAVLVKLLRHRRLDRGMTLIEHATRCVRAGEIHELVTTDQDVAAGDRVDRVGFLGFAELQKGGVIERGDLVFVHDRRVGVVAGFDECHYPNHYNVIIRTSELLTADAVGLRVEDTVRFVEGESP